MRGWETLCYLIMLSLFCEQSKGRTLLKDVIAGGLGNQPSYGGKLVKNIEPTTKEAKIIDELRIN